MVLRRLAYVIGAVVASVGTAMLGAVAVALLYQEWGQAGAIALSAAITMAVGAVFWRLVGERGELTTREGFAAVGLSWIAITAFGTLPYLLSGALSSVTNALFETAAGFTTTGASVIADPELLSHGVLIWRAGTQWMGGMGIIVLSIAILPLLGVGGVQLAKAEAPGVHPDRLTPRFRETAKRLWLLYVGFTAVEALFLVFGDMTAFEAVAHSFTTMSTGGFSTSASSVGGFSSYVQWVVIIFMFIAGASFALHFRALRKPLEYSKSPEFRLYATIIAAAAIVVVIGTRGGEWATVIRDGIFTTVSVITTTGYATADFGLWPGAMEILIVGLMFIGGMSGSTAGSVKVYRHGVLVSASRADLRRLVHPRGVFVTRLGADPVSDDIVESVQSFFLMYMFLFMTATLLFGIFESAVGSVDLVTSASAVASSLGNVGPGLGEVGPTSTYLDIATGNKWLLSFVMIVGRLEIYPVLLLFTLDLWRK